MIKILKIKINKFKLNKIIKDPNLLLVGISLIFSPNKIMRVLKIRK